MKNNREFAAYCNECGKYTTVTCEHDHKDQKLAKVIIELEVQQSDISEFMRAWSDEIRDVLTQLAGITKATMDMPSTTVELDH